MLNLSSIHINHHHSFAEHCIRAITTFTDLLKMRTFHKYTGFHQSLTCNSANFWSPVYYVWADSDYVSQCRAGCNASNRSTVAIQRVHIAQPEITQTIKKKGIRRNWATRKPTTTGILENCGKVHNKLEVQSIDCWYKVYITVLQKKYIGPFNKPKEFFVSYPMYTLNFEQAIILLLWMFLNPTRATLSCSALHSKYQTDSTPVSVPDYTCPISTSTDNDAVWLAGHKAIDGATMSPQVNHSTCVWEFLQGQQQRGRERGKRETQAYIHERTACLKHDPLKFTHKYMHTWNVIQQWPERGKKPTELTWGVLESSQKETTPDFPALTSIWPLDTHWQHVIWETHTHTHTYTERESDGERKTGSSHSIAFLTRFYSF